MDDSPAIQPLPKRIDRFNPYHPERMPSGEKTFRLSFLDVRAFLQDDEPESWEELHARPDRESDLVDRYVIYRKRKGRTVSMIPRKATITKPAHPGSDRMCIDLKLIEKIVKGTIK